MLNTLFKCTVILGLAVILSACADPYPYYPPVTVTNNNPSAASGVHYGPPSSASAASGTHYGPPARYYPAVTVTNDDTAADTMHYGN